MNVVFISSFVEAVIKVLQTMAFTDATPGTPYVKTRSELAQSDVTAVIGVIGSVTGSIAVSFTEAAIVQAVSNMFREQRSDMSVEVEDAVGELSNMICGDARRALESQGYHLRSTIPTVIRGKNHRIIHAIQGPTIVMPFTISGGATFVVEACFEPGP